LQPCQLNARRSIEWDKKHLRRTGPPPANSLQGPSPPVHPREKIKYNHPHLPMNQVTRILSAIQQGDGAASEQLLPLVYDELRKLAAQRLNAEKPGQTLQATALVHEAYLRLVDRDQPPQWDGRKHFFASAAEAMRRILIDNARRKLSLKGGGEHQRVELSHVEPAAVDVPGLDLLALDEALQRLAAKHPRKAELVKLRFFAGLSNEQAAGALGISPSTADNDWAYARAWLRLELDGGPEAARGC
jgi:RNA polymerase sigma factor (TIGR02999 family)